MLGELDATLGLVGALLGHVRALSASARRTLAASFQVATWEEMHSGAHGGAPDAARLEALKAQAESYP